jgi:hypothetical protein
MRIAQLNLYQKYKFISRIMQGSGPPTIIQMQDLYARRQQKDTARLRAYDQIMKQIMGRIRSNSQLPTHPTDILYEVPYFLMGLPKIDMQDAVTYLAFQLRAGGFEVRFTFPNLLFISWKHYEQQYLMQSCPIFQSMVQSASHTMNKVDPKKPTLLKPMKAIADKKKVQFADKKTVRPIALEYQPPLEYFKAVDAPKPPSSFMDISKF